MTAVEIQTLARQAVAAGGMSTAEGRQDVALFALGYAMHRRLLASKEAHATVLAIMACARLFAKATNIADESESTADIFLRPFRVEQHDDNLDEILLLEMGRLASLASTN